MTVPAVEKLGSQWKGEVVSINEVGSLITNFPSKDVYQFSKAAKLWFEFGPPEKLSTIRGLAAAFTDVEKGKLLAIDGSSGYVEISVRDGNAANATGLGVGSPVTLYFRV
jgi:S-adenosylmethionine hydrolase